ncbi:MAG: DNA primase [Sphingobacteriia bacterium]|nr:DNA primase [Sphingobacteriia bacterium]
MIPKETIQEILDTAQIEEVVGEFVNLKKRGSTYVGLCPFHNEKTPSFTVTPRKGIYKCFGCGKGGDVVNFLMEHEHFTYPEALKYLAKKYHITVEEEVQTEEKVQEQQEKESLFLVNDFASKYFTHNLFNSDQGRAIGLSYFKERGFREDIIHKFQLGYAIDEWDNFTSHALRQGYKLEFLEKTGLTITKENKSYDRFRGRVVFPIQNLSGRVLGFGGRTLLSDKTIPKYVNSPESEVYNKSQVLYGINLAKAEIISADNCYLVEGYTDVISLHQAGIENVVASSGTSLTNDQIRLISRYTKNITILYDGDEAGIKASFRGIDMILEHGLNVKIVLFPEGEDPDSFARTHRTSEVQEFIQKQAVNFIIFKTSLLLKEAAGDPLKKSALIKEIVGSISLIPDQITRSVYIKECSALMDIAEQTLMNVLNQIRRKNLDKKIKEKKHSGDDSPLQPFNLPSEKQEDSADLNSLNNHEKEIIRLLMQYGDRKIRFENMMEDGSIQTMHVDTALFIIKDLETDEITMQNGIYQKVINAVTAELDQGLYPDAGFYIHHNDPDISSLATGMLSQKYELANWQKVKIKVKTEDDQLKIVITEAILSLKLRVLEIKFEETQKQIRNETDEENLLGLLAIQQKIRKKISLVSNELGRIILR